MAMDFRQTLSITSIAFSALIFSGCATLIVPYGGSGTVTIVEGGLVETIVFDGGTTLNIQITREDPPEYEYLAQHVLTIGRFSPVIGSGFTSRSNIYYESIIGSYGQDEFEAAGELYGVFWTEIDVIQGPAYDSGVFSLTIRQVPRE